ncbi:hypothetical protein ACFP1Z_28785 [Streptomyces gamaensis]|uniref:Lipoprotein n=1 Tax=Streptomyces gamaensis TaxID=1763542 RepID=A0ABW0Z8B8_9ACTN
MSDGVGLRMFVRRSLNSKVSLGVLGLVLSVTVLVAGCKATPDASLLDVSVGDCLDGNQADQNHTVKTVSCDDSRAEYKVTAVIPSDDDKTKTCPSVPDDLSPDLSVAEELRGAVVQYLHKISEADLFFLG